MTTERRKGEPEPAAAGAGKRPEREARLAAALRENLRRRKRQKSARKEGAAPPDRSGA